METTSAMHGTTLRERNSARLRAEILDAAAELFTARGYATVTVDDVAAAVGVATRTVYRHFPGKDDLVLAPLRIRVQRVIEGLERADGSEEPVALLCRLIRETDMLLTPTESERRLRAIVISDERLMARHSADSARLEVAIAGYLQRTSRGRAFSELEARIHAGAVAGALRAAQRTAMDNGDGRDAFALALTIAASVLGERAATDASAPDEDRRLR
jgi:AcrR family transcriptional regulator